MRDQFFRQWVLATWAGWALGIPFIAILALIGEVVGIGGAQVLVGAGMGAGIGLMQGRRIRAVLHRFAPWFWSCVIGLALPFLAIDVATAVGRASGYSLYGCVAVAGIIVGAWQALLLRRRTRKAAWWVAASIGGWFLAAAVVALADVLFRTRAITGIPGLVLYLLALVAGGLLLGIVTGMTLSRILDVQPDADAQPA